MAHMQSSDPMLNILLHTPTRKQLKALNFHSPEYPLADWARLEFDQEFEYDYHLN
jgi:hypothetical protein